MSKISGAIDISIGEYLAFTQLNVPLFQREYVWEQEEITEFWDDLVKDEIHFLGSIILNDKNVKDSDLVDVIDGQQRTISLLILLSEIGRLFAELAGDRKERYEKNADEHAGHIRQLITSKIDERDRTAVISYKLILPNEADNSALKKVLDGEQSGVLNFDSTAKKFRTLLKDHLKTKTSKNKKIDELIKIKNRILTIRIVRIFVSTNDDAYSIFENMNARGADLGAADLVKNYLFQKITNQNKVHKEWEKVRTTISNVNRKSLDATSFLRYYWIGRHKHLSKKKLYRGVRNEVDNKQISPEKMLQQIGNFRETVEKIYLDGFDNWKKAFTLPVGKSPRVIEWFNYKNNLRYFPKSIQYLPVWTAIAANLRKIDINKEYFLDLFLAIEKINFLYSLALQNPTNKIDTLLSGIGRQILEKIEKSDANGIASAVRKGVTEINDLLAQNINEDSVNDFVKKLDYQQRLDRRIINFILINLEYSEKGYDLQMAEDSLSLEHVFPEAAAEKSIPNWPKATFDYATLGHGIGNLTLLSQTGPNTNSDAGSKPFEVKRDDYLLGSGFKINTYFKDINKWDGPEIEARLKKIQTDVWKRWGFKKKSK